MKLFENGVGRPSNEILRKRRKFYGLIIGCIAIVLFVGAYTLTSFNVKRLSGAASNTYTIRFYYDLYGYGKLALRKSQNITYGKETKLAAVDKNYIPDGYVFLGWRAWRSQDSKWYGYNKSNKLGWYKKTDIKKYYLYKDKEVVSKTTKAGTRVNMYTVLKIKDGMYIIRFQPNGADGMTITQGIKHGVSTPLKINTYKREGFDFQGWKAYRVQEKKWYGYNKSNKLGWYKESDINKYYLYKNGEKVAKTAQAGQTVVMYAEWKVKAPYYEIRYYNNNKQIDSQAIKYGTYTSLLGRRITFSRGWKAYRYQDGKWYGYNSANKLGWYKESDIKKYYLYKNGEKVAYTAKAGTVVDMYAELIDESKYYRVVFNSNGGSGQMDDQYIEYGKSTSLTNSKFTKTRYYFKGWRAWRSQDDKLYGYNKSNKLGWYKAGDIKKYYLYKNGEKVAKTALAGQTVVMTAEWGKHD